MPSTNFNNDTADGIVVADGFGVPTATGGQLELITSDGEYTVTSLTFSGTVGGIPTYEIDSVSVGLPTYTVAQANALDPQPAEGSVIYVTDGNAGSPCLAVRSGGAWLRIALGAAIAAV